MLSGQIQAQAVSKATEPKSPSSAAVDYSAEPIVIERLDHLYTMSADGTGTRRFTVVARIQSDAAVHQFGILKISFASSSEHVEMNYVRVRHSDGSLTETPATAGIEMPNAVTAAAPFYSDLKELQVPVRNLAVGDRLEWQATIVRTKPEAEGQFWGQEDFVTDGVVLEQLVELHAPRGIYLNVWSSGDKPVQSETSTEQIYQWQSTQLKPTVGPAAEAEKERIAKQPWTAQQEMDEREGKLPSVAWSTFKSWEAVAAWYRALEGDRIRPSDPAVQAKVAELTAGKATEQEKARAVYAYVSSQIRYVGVAFGIGRYQPHPAVEVLENQYGDCKDKHTLLAAMLTQIGLHPDAVLIGEGVRFNQAVPSPESFNHLITRVSVEGQTTWLDSTPEIAPFGVLTYSTRDKQVLIVPDSGDGRLDRTPASLPFPAIDRMDAVGTLADTGISNSRLVLILRGDAELIFRAALHQVSPAQFDQVVQQFSHAIGYAGTTSHVEVSRPEDTADPLKISYDYKREKAGDWDNLKIIPQLMPVSLPRFQESDPPVQAIFLGTIHTETSTSAMKLPDGWSATLPDAVHAKSPWATYDETYRFENGTVHAERTVAILKERVPVSEWKAYKEFTDRCQPGMENYIQLTRGGSIQGWLAQSANDSKASELIAAGRVSIRQHDFDTAQSQLDQARSINPNQATLWASFGYLEFQRGHMAIAITDYQKELELHPGNHGTYGALAEAQNIVGQEKEARKTLESWAAAEPQNIVPITALISMLLDEGHPAEAVSAAKAGIARLPESLKSDQRLNLLTGRAQILAGQKEQGQATLLAVLKSTAEPGMMNDAAYELGDNGLSLALAEQTARDALAKLSAGSKSWSLKGSPEIAIADSRRIASNWDTLGWILYREGKVDEALSFIEPAWAMRQVADIGRHMAEIAEAKGNHDDALRYFELAQATFPAYLRPNVRKTPGAVQKEIAGQIEVLRKAGAKEPAGDADEILKQLRTISLGPSNGVTGTAEYRVLLGDGIIQDFVSTGGDSLAIAPKRIVGAHLPAAWPKGSDIQLVRNAKVTCDALQCELMFEP